MFSKTYETCLDAAKSFTLAWNNYNPDHQSERLCSTSMDQKSRGENAVSWGWREILRLERKPVRPRLFFCPPLFCFLKRIAQNVKLIHLVGSVLKWLRCGPWCERFPPPPFPTRISQLFSYATPEKRTTSWERRVIQSALLNEANPREVSQYHSTFTSRTL